MKVYVSHATSFDYRCELYAPLSDPLLDEYNFFFPHEQTDIAVDTRDIIESSDCIIAEVSYASTGQGIELAWAHDAQRPILCIYRSDACFSSSLRILCDNFIHYTQVSELPGILKGCL